MNKRYYLAIALSLISLREVGGQIQQPHYTFQAIAKPGTRIGGHTFSKNTTIDSFAINASGEYAFLATWKHGRGALFTSKRLIAQNGDRFDGVKLRVIESHSDVKVNGHGQVAYEGKFTFDLDKTRREYWGLFVDRRLVVSGRRSAFAPGYELHEDGTIYLYGPTEPLVSHSSALISLRQEGHRPPLPDEAILFSTATNDNEQKVVAINLSPSGFMLLLATPITR